ncbi:MAG: hypothetical protein IPH74_12515 [Bacteroidetes bacterium]|nr:hypothetical protein [Bacteroidota bacterium]
MKNKFFQKTISPIILFFLYICIVKDKQNIGLDFIIDKLTNSIENTLTGEVFDTEIVRLKGTDLKQIKKIDWQFDWRAELRDKTKAVFKLTTTNNPTIIQGLLSIEDKRDHIFMHLIESARFNKGKEKVYFGVPGNLIAYACKVSVDKGFEGFLAFDAKTALINTIKKHLRHTLSWAKNVGRCPVKVIRLISQQYFKKLKLWD